MERSHAASPEAARALDLVEGLQRRFTGRLERIARDAGDERWRFGSVEWLRDEGRHGGGDRRELGATATLDRASVNVSQVHYDDDPNRRLGSATALSTIVHPRNPRAPSAHVHVSWTELRDGSGSWRVMADLNPAIPLEDDAERFRSRLREAAPEAYEAARAQGDRYFHIPALDRHRGVAHFYLEGYGSGDPERDRSFARRVGEAALDVYGEILAGAVGRPFDAADLAAQRAYHTAYLFQVLTLDRGTSSGVLVHDQNDVGILGSLPSRVDPRLLASWRDAVPAPQEQLVDAIVDALPAGDPASVDEAAKLALARVLRRHYGEHPEALALQASGDVLPPTVANHRST